MPSPILHQSSWAQTSLGNPIQLFSALGDGTQRPLLFVGGVHGDEPEGVELAEKFLQWLQKNHKENFHSWLLIPCLNVDGYKKNERTNGRGVDLNRNFPSTDWSPEAKAPRYFPGSEPASEPEVKALCSLIAEKKPQVIVHFHSWEPCVVYTGAAGKTWAEKAGLGTGYQVREDIGYPTPGSLGQYGWLNCQTPVVCIEEKEGVDLKTIWPRFSEAMKALVIK
jgi:protein MpaA